MLRGMVFLDHMNFNIAVNDYYKTLGATSPKLDYGKMMRTVVAQKPNIDYVKSFIFVPKPDDFLMKDSYLAGYYKWVSGMSSARYIDVVDGRYVARPTSAKDMDIADRSSYYKVEKGTDLNLAIQALTKGFFDAYDVAFVMSADTDYISLYKQLKAIGKIVVVVAVKGQSIGKIIPEVDDYIILDDAFFSQCLRT